MFLKSKAKASKAKCPSNNPRDLEYKYEYLIREPQDITLKFRLPCDLGHAKTFSHSFAYQEMINSQRGKLLSRSFEGGKSSWAILKREGNTKKSINILKMKLRCF